MLLGQLNNLRTQKLSENLKIASDSNRIALVIVGSAENSGAELYQKTLKAIDSLSLSPAQYGAPMVFMMNKDSAENDSIRKDFKLDYAWLPIVLVFAHKGDFVSGVLNDDFNAESLLNALPTKSYSSVVNGIVNRESQIAVFYTKKNKELKETMTVVNDLNKKMDNSIKVYEFNINDMSESAAYTLFGISDKDDMKGDVVTVVLSPQGEIKAVITGVPEETELVKSVLDLSMGNLKPVKSSSLSQLAN